MKQAMSRRRVLGGVAAMAATPAVFADSLSVDGPSGAVLPPSIAALRPRRAEALPITLAEREDRLERARVLMRQHGMGALLMAGGTSQTYFAGLRWWNSERMLAYVLPATGAPFLVCPAFEEARLRELLGAAPMGAETRVLTWQEDESPYRLVAQGLKETKPSATQLGIEERTPFVFANEIARACPGWTVVDGTPVVAGCRMVKSDAELRLMRLANQVTLQVYQAAWAAGRPGMTTAEFAALVNAGYQRVGFAGEVSCQAGIYSALPHGSISPQIIRENQVVLIDDGCTVEGYQSDISRSFVYGKPTDRMQRVFDVVHRAQKAAAAAARPGVPCEAVDAAARDVITAAGFGPDYRTFSHRVGHGIGMDGHEWTYLVRGNKTPLAARMTFSDEPGIYLKGEFGIRLEDDMVITPEGGKLMTPQSNSLTEPFA